MDVKIGLRSRLETAPFRQGTAVLANSADQWPTRSYLGRLPAPAREVITRLGTRRSYAHSGEILIQQGDRSDHVILLLRACVKVTAETWNGLGVLLAVRMSGDIVGEMAALDGDLRSATVTTCGPADVRTISRSDFNAFLRADSSAGMALNRMEAERLRWANRRRADFGSCPVGVRLARVLIDLANTYGVDVGRGRIGFDMRLTQAELAHLVGAAEVTINKELAVLKGRGLVETRRHARPEILDLPGLKALAGERCDG